MHTVLVPCSFSHQLGSWPYRKDFSPGLPPATSNSQFRLGPSQPLGVTGEMGTGRDQVEPWTGCCPDSAPQWSKLRHAGREPSCAQLSQTVGLSASDSPPLPPPQFPALNRKEQRPWSQPAGIPVLASLLTCSLYFVFLPL